ncbi:MAG: hypothetical protein EXQ85_05530 [Alphaproteobacteria bacterium]|nr:hypothetical protein [Alphaproteobacteria bacterium]
MALLGGFASPVFCDLPDIYVDAAARQLAVRSPTGGLIVSGSLRSIVSKTWLRRDGLATAEVWPEVGQAGADGQLRGDRSGCLYRHGGRAIALVQDAAALDEDCGRAEVVISLVPIRRRCQAPELVVDRFSLWRSGAHAIWLRPSGVRVEATADRRGRHPWVDAAGRDASSRSQTARRARSEG